MQDKPKENLRTEGPTNTGEGPIQTADEPLPTAEEPLPTGGEALTSAEILARAKRENEKFGDERQRGRMQWGYYAGFIAVEFTAVVVLLVLTIVQDRLPTEIYLILFTGIAAQNVAQACICTRKMRIRIIWSVTSAVIVAGAALYWVLWILELCGVNI